MLIETTFNEEDTIWFLHNGKALDSVIRGMKIERRKDKDSGQIIQETIYLCSKDDNAPMVYIKVNEILSFPTKEALLQSL